MALSGTHIACGYYGTPFNKGPTPVPTLLSTLVWSQTMANPGTTTNAAPGAKKDYGPLIFEVYASADIYVSYGAPSVIDAASGARVFVPATTVCDFLVQPGDKLAWTTA